MGFRTLHLLVPKERDLMRTQEGHGEAPIGALHYDGAGEAPHLGAGAGVGNMATVPTLQARNLEAHHNKGAHGNGVMEVGMSRAGEAGMLAMIPIRNMIITINPGIQLPIPSHHNHVLRHNNPLPLCLFPSHLHQQ